MERSRELLVPINNVDAKESEFESDQSYFKLNVNINEKLEEQYVNLVSKLEKIEESEKSERGKLYKKASQLFL